MWTNTQRWADRSVSKITCTVPGLVSSDRETVLQSSFKVGFKTDSVGRFIGNIPWIKVSLSALDKWVCKRLRLWLGLCLKYVSDILALLDFLSLNSKNM